MTALALLIGIALTSVIVGCGDDDDDGDAPTEQPTSTEISDTSATSSDAPADSPTATAPPMTEIDLETFTAGQMYRADVQEVANSGVSGAVILTGVADGDVSINVSVEGLSEGDVKLYGGVASCPATDLPEAAETILELEPLAGGSSVTEPVGVSTEAFGGQNIFVFSGPWAVVIFGEAGDPVACGMIPQSRA
jgi:hypothetical protein